MKPTNQPATHPPNHPSIYPPSPLLILAAYTLLSLFLTYPLILNLTTAVPNDIGDPLLNTWILAWVDHALLTDPLNLFNANIFYPLPNTLAYSEHLFSTALIALPLQLLTNEPIVAYNLSLLLTFPLAAFGMYLLILRWTHHRGAAFIAGLIFAFAPYRFAAIAHLQLLTFQWLPYALLFLDIILTPRGPHQPPFRRRQPTSQPANQPPIHPSPLPPCPPAPIHHYLALIFFLLLQILASWYLALYTLVILAIYLLANLFTRRFNRPSLPRLIFTFLISFLLIVPFALPYLPLLDQLRQTRPLSLALSLAAFPTDYAAAAPFNRLFGPLTAPLRNRPGFTEENTLFLGLAAPILALAALCYGIFRVAYSVQKSRSSLSAPRSTLHALRSPLIIVLFTTALLAILLTFPTPYALLASLFPPSTIVRVPPRWIIPALFALSALAGYGYSILNSQFIIRNSPFTIHHSQFTIHHSQFRPFIISLLLILESLSIPLPLAQVENRSTLNPAYHWLAGQTEPFALVELPLHSAPAPEFPEVKRLYASTLGWWPLVNGYSGYTPPRQPKLAEALAHFPDPAAVAALQAIVPAAIPYGLPPRPLLLLVHPGEAPLDRAHWETVDRWQAERNPALYPLGQFEGDYLYQVRAIDPRQLTAPPLAEFGENRQIRLIALSKDGAPPADSLEPNPDQQFRSLTSQLALYWQTTAPLAADYTIFIHLRAADGFVRAQADGPPVGGHYPTTAWSPGDVIQDVHPLPAIDSSQVDHLAIGLYDPATGERLPAFDPNGERLPDDARLIPLPRP